MPTPTSRSLEQGAEQGVSRRSLFAEAPAASAAAKQPRDVSPRRVSRPPAWLPRLPCPTTFSCAPSAPRHPASPSASDRRTAPPPPVALRCLPGRVLPPAWRWRCACPRGAVSCATCASRRPGHRHWQRRRRCRAGRSCASTDATIPFRSFFPSTGRFMGRGAQVGLFRFGARACASACGRRSSRWADRQGAFFGEGSGPRAAQCGPRNSVGLAITIIKTAPVQRRRASLFFSPTLYTGTQYWI